MRLLSNSLMFLVALTAVIASVDVQGAGSLEMETEESQQVAPAQGSSQGEETLEAELLRLNARLQLLEEDLLYPASSRIAVYLSMDLGELFALDAVTLKLNGQDVTHHLYTERQVNALYKGGVQKLYVGNARQGTNRLTAFFSGIGPHQRDYKRATTIEFEQSFEPVFVELLVTDDTGSQQPEFVATVF